MEATGGRSTTPVTADEAIGALVPSPLHRLWQLLIGSHRQRGFRLMQWATGGAVYAGSALLMSIGIVDGWMRPLDLAGWCGFVLLGKFFAYVALRSGWSERFEDPALTGWQLVMGVIASEWAYLICGPMRMIALFPLLVLFAFVAFAMRWRQILVLTALTLVSLGGVVWWRIEHPVPWIGQGGATSIPVDLINYCVVLLLLPTLAIIAARLSALRSALHARRTELTQALAEVQRLATTDELTGLSNRRRMMERLEEARQRGEAGAGSFCVAVIDLDHFKRINDRLGHAQGDAVLREFARCATAVLDGGQVLGRWGGEEFLLLMPDTPVAKACHFVEALLTRVRVVDGAGAPLSFSAGVAAWREGDAVLDVVLRADRAMYRAKQRGRSAVIAEPGHALPS